jgi:iron(III) transport system substrate-binding protein
VKPAWLMKISWTQLPASVALLGMMCSGCTPGDSGDTKSPSQVVVYCSVDETYARAVLDRFEETSGVRVTAVFDSEAGKTTGLVNRLIAESQSGRPRASVFWSGELFGTMRLAEMGLLEPFDPPSAADIPKRLRDDAHRWTATSARARVLAFDSARTQPEEVPDRWEDIGKAQYSSSVAIANPLFGTTRGHVAAMFALWGPERGRNFLSGLRGGGTLILDGNSATVRAVIDGRARFAVTDSDDMWAARRAGATLDVKMPDMGDGGTLLIPCSVAVIKGGRESAAAKKLADFLVSADVERMLAQSESRNIPVRESLRSELNLDWPGETRIGFDEILKSLAQTDAAVREFLIR